MPTARVLFSDPVGPGYHEVEFLDLNIPCVLFLTGNVRHDGTEAPGLWGICRMLMRLQILPICWEI